ncbi:MAG: glycine--tRNA ligase subunit beta [Brevinematia bacterium]
MVDNLLIEVGVEEIPHEILTQSLRDFENICREKLELYGFDYSEMKILGTPRRLSLILKDLSEKTKEKIVEKKGPSLKAAFDEKDKPTKALMGFLSSNNAKLNEVFKENGYVYLKQKTGGIDIRGLVGELVKEAIFSISFPKVMKWGESNISFVRPIKWITAIYGKDKISFTLENLSSSNVTYGHRILSVSPVKIERAIDYENILRNSYVIADYNERKKIILEGVEAKAKNLKAKPLLDERLLDTLINLTEFPVVSVGEFEEEFLSLPKEVLVSEMVEHQKYIPLENESGELINKFLIVLNTIENPEIIRGNERVIRARFSDGKFFYDEDRKVKLETYLPRLGEVLFIKGLGSMKDKVERIKFLTEKISNIFGWQDVLNDALRTAILSKCDLVTNMVYEFPELQGVIGYYYALHSGEKGNVAKSIKEHYQPRYSGDALPSYREGILVSLADKLDNLFALYSRGNFVTGSKDPYGLRRQTLGVIRILIECKLNLDILKLLSTSIEIYQGYLSISKEEFEEKVKNFITTRTKTVLKEYGFEFDEIEAGITTVSDIYDAFLRIKAIHSLRQTEGFKDLALTFKRIKNIIKNEKIIKFKEELLIEEAEKKLYKLYKDSYNVINQHLEKKEYEKCAIALAGYRETVDEFFDKVLVMDENRELKDNRVALLSTIDKLFMGLIDFEKIVVE